MKSIIFCTSYIKDRQAWDDRYQRWLDYYNNEKPIKADKKFMIDDGSPFMPPETIIKSVPHDAPLSLDGDDNLIIRFNGNLGRQNVSTYPGWWRSFLHSIEMAKALGVDKIIHIESDAYILSQRLADFINGVESGWHVLWTQRYRFPETAIQVICRDQFAAFEKFKADHADMVFPDLAERLLPFTSVDQQFKGDRYSEFRKNRGIFRSKKFDRFAIFQRDFFCEPIPADADFVTQLLPHQKIAFRRKG
ncbi:MAG: hypothetical protein RR376_10775 [Janthinobacterium sp.]|jgi:hypothetical protein